MLILDGGGVTATCIIRIILAGAVGIILRATSAQNNGQGRRKAGQSASDDANVTVRLQQAFLLWSLGSFGVIAVLRL